MDRVDQKPTTPPAEKPFAFVTRARKHFLRKRRLAKIMEAAGYQDLADKLSMCGEYNTILACSHCGESHKVPMHCSLRICPLCSYKVARERGDYLVAMTAHMKHPKLLTLTMPRWKDPPREGIRFLRLSFNRLRKHDIMKDVVGGAYSIEVKVKEDGFHIHIHALLDAPFIAQQRLFTVWNEIIGHTCSEPDIRSAQEENAKRYAAKYAAKAADFDSDESLIVQWYDATKGMRLFATFGKWYNATINQLDGTAPSPPPQSVCPHCKSVGTMFFARDGPFLYGAEIWRTLESKICPKGELYFPIPEIEEILKEKGDAYEGP